MWKVYSYEYKNRPKQKRKKKKKTKTNTLPQRAISVISYGDSQSRVHVREKRGDLLQRSDNHLIIPWTRRRFRFNYRAEQETAVSSS